eukprot:jgi/Psemu1/285996/fgenesh1_pg.112_\
MPLLHCRTAVRSFLLISLVLSTTAPHAFAWNPRSPALSTRSSNKRWNGQRKISTSSTSLLAGDTGVMNFVKGLDSALGNPTAYSAAESASKSWASSVGAEAYVAPVSAAAAQSGGVGMNGPNPAVVAGGGLAFVAVLGLAFVLLTQKEEEEGTVSSSSIGGGLNTSFGMEDVTPLPKRIDESASSTEKIEAVQQASEQAKTEEPKKAEPDDDPSWSNDVNEALLATESALRKETESKLAETESKLTAVTNANGTLIEQLSEAEEENEVRGGLLAKLKAKLVRKTEELETNQELLETETTLRKETESKLEEATTDNKKLTETLEAKEKALVETTEKWNYTKTKLEMEVQEKESMKKEMKEVAETNRVLEDKYELEQNTLRKTQVELDSTKSTLESTQNRLARTQGELTRYHSELQKTKTTLWNTEVKLENLEEEQKSVRTLGTKLWRLSKEKVSNRFQSVGDRLKNPRRRKKRR